MKRLLSLFALILLPPLMTGCNNDYGPRWGWGHMMNYGFGCGFGGMFMWIIFLILLGILIYFVFQFQKMKNQIPTQAESHLDILKKRYAKGEINKEDFDRMKKDLEA